LNQDYPDFEVLALDDNSRDRTGAILAELAAEDSRLRVLQGQPLPAGWIGKVGVLMVKTHDRVKAGSWEAAEAAAAGFDHWEWRGDMLVCRRGGE
jgi:glycosyltransferase involved in cell wall biosynthesis